MANYIPISTVTVGNGGASGISFIGIPQTYTDLVVKLSLRSNYATSGDVCPVFMQFNNSSASAYSGKQLVYFQASIASASNPYNVTTAMSVGFANSTGPTANTFTSTDVYIPNYTSANYKSVSVDFAQSQNSTSNYTFAVGTNANLWSNTAAINAINFYANTGGSSNFAQYSTATLYGIRKY